jgi:hypothetical protein
MQYPAFKQAKVMLSQQGWTKSTGNNQSLEISSKGIKWLEAEKNRAAEEAQSDESQPVSKLVSPRTPFIEAIPASESKKIEITTGYDDFEQI